MKDSNAEVRVLIVGAGPAGFYTIEELTKLLAGSVARVTFDVVNADVRPGGLLMYGVAPDHPKIRSVGKVFDEILQRNSVNYFGNVSFGRDFLLHEVAPYYDAVVFAFGAQSDRKLGIVSEDLPGSYAAREFVNWYNGHPSANMIQPNLACQRAVVVGAGNVAIDVARILSRDPEELRATDISSDALRALQGSQIQEVVVVVRRGPEDVKFTPAELKALGELKGVGVSVFNAPKLWESLEGKTLEREAAKNIEILKALSQHNKHEAKRVISFLFYTSPVSLVQEAGVLAQVQFVRNELRDSKLIAVEGSDFVLPAGIFIPAVGYDVAPVANLPYDSVARVVANQEGSVTGAEFSRCYVVGWAADGPVGIIGTNKVRARKVSQIITSKIEQGQRVSDDSREAFDLAAFFNARNVKFVSKADWNILDAIEQQRGAAIGRPRERFVAVDEMFAALLAKRV